MNAQVINHVASTIREQIFWSISKVEFWSWGCSKMCATTYQNMPALALRVSGLQHKGWVVVALDEARDCYKVFLQNVRYETKKVIDEVYCDNLGYILDMYIERGTKSHEEYSKEALRDSARKMA